jgi:two-component system alkaline phosphatase synthesis response regulator PhoP
VILLDVMLPRRDGLDVCRALRAEGIRTPIIFLTARTQELDKVLGLELGADDYVTKPFSSAELRARIKAVTRRMDDPGTAARTYRFGDCEVDFERAEVRRGGRPIATTALEFRLLGAFIQARGRLLTREQLIRQAWGDGTFIGDRVVDTHILNLRKKIEPVPSAPRFLRSVRGMGYRFEG